ncbi:hypothetical protein [Streptomyces sp. NBC_01176]|nr:hypothetical protein OG199_43925 [Streptomyces sp. NBC_01176]
MAAAPPSSRTRIKRILIGFLRGLILAVVAGATEALATWLLHH